MERTINPEEVYRMLKEIEQKMVTKQELTQIVETIAILANPDTMRQIEASEAAIKAGRIRRVPSADTV